MRITTFETFKHSSSQDSIFLKEEQLHSIQRILLEIMDDIINLCDEHNIQYFLGGGTALGAIRHQGFIPWDDDVDINMTRADYEKFIPLFERLYGEKYWIHTPETTKNYALLMAKICKKGTVLKSRDDFQNDECGVSVDIFIIENTYNSLILRDIHGVLSLAAGYLLSCRKFYRDRGELTALFGKEDKAFRLKVSVGKMIRGISVDTLTHFANTVNSMCKNNNSKLVSGCAGRYYFFGELYERSAFCETRNAVFEGREVKVPINVEAYLTHCYGNWQVLPEENKREHHVYFEVSV